ncbi:MAG: endonuclease Q family protein [Candidatus Woesearchaeota archaeon]
MKIFADLHIHSKYSRATSKNLDLANLERYARIKGVNLMGTGDFQHPDWNKELKSQLQEDGSGILKTQKGFNFLLSSEVSLIYSQDGKGRRNHLVLLAPDFAVVDQIAEYLLSKGRIDYDGRPIFKVPGNDFTYDLKHISDDIEIIPAHIWTPHFSLFGDYNKYTKVEDCFKDQTKHIYAMETGISSDPPMNWRLSQLDRFNLVSFSDSHSFWPWRLGREATIFALNNNNIAFKDIIKAIRTGQGLFGTVEAEPNFGKYHFTGHKKCEVCLNPKDALRMNYACPKCGSKMPVGVVDRIEELADRKQGSKSSNAKHFYSLIPLSELIATLNGTSVSSKKAWDIYFKLVNSKRSEFDILLNTPEEELRQIADPKLVKVILMNRTGQIRVQPGYDGNYGIPLLNNEEIITYKPTEEELKKAKKYANAITSTPINDPDENDKQTGLGQFV